MQLDCFEKIRFIKCKSFDAKTARKTVNLETLICSDLCLPFKLDNLPNLKEVALFPFNPVSTALESLLQQRTNLSRFDLKIVLNGVECSIDDFPEPDEQIWFDREGWLNLKIFTKKAKLIAKNYFKIMRPLPFQTIVDYTELNRVFNGQIPGNFFKNFPEIYSVSVSQHVRSSSDLLDFLQNCNDLQKLRLMNCQYDQELYQKLLHFQSLRHLTIEELTGQVDFSFFLQFKHLDDFRLLSDCMPIDLVGEFLKRRRKNFSFRKLNSEIKIQMRDLISSRYWLFINGKLFGTHGIGGEQTLDNVLLYLKNHEYRKFFI